MDLIVDGAKTRHTPSAAPSTTHTPGASASCAIRAAAEPPLYVHDQLKLGDVVRVRGPRNNFPLVEAPRYLFIAGGIGITPILPMVSAAEAAGAAWELVYGGRQRASMAFLDELAKYGDKVSVRPQDETGLLDLDSLLGEPRSDTKIYC